MVGGGITDGRYFETRLDSRLTIVRQQGGDPATQDVKYYEWTGAGFKLLFERNERKRDEAQ